MAFKKQGQIKLKWVVGKYLDNSDELHSYRDLASNLLKWSWFRITSLAEKANSVLFWKIKQVSSEFLSVSEHLRWALML